MIEQYITCIFSYLGILCIIDSFYPTSECFNKIYKDFWRTDSFSKSVKRSLGLSMIIAQIIFNLLFFGIFKIF